MPRASMVTATSNVVERKRGRRGSFSSATELRQERSNRHEETIREECLTIVTPQLLKNFKSVIK